MKPVDFITSLIRAAADNAGIDPKLLISCRRNTAICEARWACWVVMREAGFTLQEIASAFRRTHGAVIHGLKHAADHQGNREASFRALCLAVQNHQSTTIP